MSQSPIVQQSSELSVSNISTNLMKSMLKLQFAYEEAKKALEDREEARVPTESSKPSITVAKLAESAPSSVPLDKIALITDLLQTYLLENQ